MSSIPRARSALTSSLSGTRSRSYGKATEDDQKKFDWLRRKERRAFEDETLGRLYAEEEKVEED